MRVGGPTLPVNPIPLDVRVAIANRIQAAGHASSPTSLPVKPVESTPENISFRRLSAHVLDIRV